MKAVPSPFSFKEPDSGGKEARRLRRGGKYNGLCFRAAGDSLDGQGAFSRRQGKDAGGVLYEPGPSAGSRKSEFRQLVIDGITQLEQGGGGIGNGIIRRYRIGSSVLVKISQLTELKWDRMLNFPASFARACVMRQFSGKSVILPLAAGWTTGKMETGMSRI